MAFVKGQSGNPSGKPKTIFNLREEAGKHAQAALLRLVDILASEDEKAALGAAKELLDRGFGKATQAITGADQGPMKMIVEWAKQNSE